MRTLRLLAFSLPALLVYAGGNPFEGVWKLDSRASKFTTGDPSFMFVTMQIEAAGNGLKSTASAANGEGFATDFTFNCSLDGTPCPVVSSMPMRGSSAVDTISLKRIDDRTIDATGSKSGKLVYTDHRVVSADGTRITVIRQGTTADGKKYSSTIVMVRSR